MKSVRRCFSVVVFILAVTLLAAGFLAATACRQHGVTPSPTPISTPISTGTPAPSPTASPPTTPAVSATPLPTPLPTTTLSPTPRVGPTACKADFFAQPTAGEGPTWVQFTDQSTGNITNWEWDFDGNGSTDSTEQKPQHNYDKNGSYSVTLKVRGPGCEDKRTREGYIQVSKCKT